MVTCEVGRVLVDVEFQPQIMVVFTVSCGCSLTNQTPNVLVDQGAEEITRKITSLSNSPSTWGGVTWKARRTTSARVRRGTGWVGEGGRSGFGAKNLEGSQSHECIDAAIRSKIYQNHTVMDGDGM